MSLPLRGDAKDAVALLQRMSAWHLGGYDGCLCTSFAIMNFAVDVHCHKSTGDGTTQIVVACRSLGTTEADCQSIAAKVKSQILEQEPFADVQIVING